MESLYAKPQLFLNTSQPPTTEICLKEELAKAGLLRSPNLATCQNPLVSLSRIQILRPRPRSIELESPKVVPGNVCLLMSSPSDVDAPVPVPFTHYNKCELNPALSSGWHFSCVCVLL